MESENAAIESLVKTLKGQGRKVRQIEVVAFIPHPVAGFEQRDTSYLPRVVEWAEAISIKGTMI